MKLVICIFQQSNFRKIEFRWAKHWLRGSQFCSRVRGSWNVWRRHLWICWSYREFFPISWIKMIFRIMLISLRRRAAGFIDLSDQDVFMLEKFEHNMQTYTLKFYVFVRKSVVIWCRFKSGKRSFTFSKWDKRFFIIFFRCSFLDEIIEKPKRVKSWRIFRFTKKIPVLVEYCLNIRK